MLWKVINNKMFLVFALIVGATLLYINRTSDPKPEKSEAVEEVQTFNQNADTETLIVDSSIPFGEAFTYARSVLGDNSEFIWNNTLYTTNHKDWD